MITIELSEDDAAILDELVTLGIICSCPHISEDDVKNVRVSAKKMHICSKWEPVAREVIRQMAEQTNKVRNV